MSCARGSAEAASAYRSALADAGASRAVGRGILGDELRSAEIVDRLSFARISSADVARFRSTFAPVLAREITVSPAPSWLPEGRGVALATSAPAAVFEIATGRRDDDSHRGGELRRRANATRRPRSALSRATSLVPP